MVWGRLVDLEVLDYAGPACWRWRLTGPGGRFLADHEVDLAPSAEFEAFAAPDRRQTSEAALVDRVGHWVGDRVLGPVGAALAAQAPVTVRLRPPAEAKVLGYRPWARLGERPPAGLAGRELRLSAGRQPSGGEGAGGRAVGCWRRPLRRPTSMAPASVDVCLSILGSFSFTDHYALVGATRPLEQHRTARAQCARRQSDTDTRFLMLPRRYPHPSMVDLEHVRALAREVLRPLAQAGEPGRVNRPLVRALGDCGLLPQLFPERLGGASPAGVSATQLCRLREELARETTEAETALALQGLGAYPIVQSGSEALASRWVPGVARGELVAAFALTEPGAGSDAAALVLAAERDRGGWRLTGEKAWISNAPDADVYTVFARTTAKASARGITAFVVPGDADGLGGEPLRMLAPHAIGLLVFDGVFVPDDGVIGKVDGGFGVAMRTLDLFRPSVGAFAVGMAQAALDVTVGHAATRRAFGRPIAEFQAVSHQLAEMATRTEAARLLVYEAARAFDEGRAAEVTRRSAMAKLYATETAQFVVDAAIQIHGARALRAGHLLEHLYREVRAPRIYEGTSEIQREIIARALLRAAGDVNG